MSVWHFTDAITREPAPSVVDGLRVVNRGDPNYEAVKSEHSAYVAAMRCAGVSVTVLSPLQSYPDSIFVEDPALVFTDGAILLRPGNESRAGEVAEIAKDIRVRFETVLELPCGHVDGGDVLITPNFITIGLSERTDRKGAEGLIGCLAQLGKVGEIRNTPRDVLHLKSDCSLLDDETVLSTERLATTGAFGDLNIILVPEGEEMAANALRINDWVLVAREFPQTIDILSRAGYQIIALATQEIAKIDAGLSCMSLRWHA